LWYTTTAMSAKKASETQPETKPTATPKQKFDAFKGLLTALVKVPKKDITEQKSAP